MLHAKLLQSCLTLYNPLNHSPPGSSVHGILQARIVEWVALLTFRRSSRPRDQTHTPYVSHWQAGSLPLVPPGKPQNMVLVDSKFSFFLKRKKTKITSYGSCQLFLLIDRL